MDGALDQANHLLVSGSFDPDLPRTVLQLASGEWLQLPTASLTRVTFELPSELAQTEVGHLVIPVIAEELVVSKQVVPREKVRIEKISDVAAEQVSVALTGERFEITRVPFHTRISGKPEPRTDGDETVISVVAEEIVVEKALFLVEEIRVRRVRETRHESMDFDLLRERVVITQEPA